MEFSNKDLVDIWNVLSKISEEKLGTLDFRWDISTNMIAIKDKISFLEEAGKEMEELLPYNRKRLELIQDYCSRDEDGNCIIDERTGLHAIKAENLVLYKEKLNELKENYKDSIKKEEDRIKQLPSLLKKKVEINFSNIERKDLPEELSAREMFTLREAGIIVDTKLKEQKQKKDVEE